MLAAVNDLAFSAEGYMWMGTNVVANVAHLIVLRKVPHTPHALHTPVYATACWVIVLRKGTARAAACASYATSSSAYVCGC